MMENIYSSISSFSICQDTIDVYKNNWDKKDESRCENAINEYFTDHNHLSDNTCPIALSYLYHINRYQHNLPKEAACYYLYYWIHEKLKSYVKPSEIKNVYDDIIKLYNRHDTIGNICTTYKNSTGFEDKMDDVKYMYEISMCLDITESKDKIKIETEFCKTLLDKISQYNQKNRNVEIESIAQDITQPCKNNIGSAI
ncbi:variable surface protein, partial [Plasmodium gonderi]